MIIKDFCKEWKSSLKRKWQATLFIIQVGNNEASNRYVRNKVRDAEEVGLKAEAVRLSDSVRQSIVEDTLKKIVQQHKDKPCGIIIQLPLPAHLDVDRLIKLIPARMDVDGFKADSNFSPCTPLGIVTYLTARDFNFDGADAVVIGRSDLVGEPLARMLTHMNCTVTLCHSHTKDIYKYIKDADLVVSAVGKANFLDCKDIDGVVVDVGINFDENGKMVGDCFNTEGKDVTPVPGGVGLLTRCALLENMKQCEDEWVAEVLRNAEMEIPESLWECFKNNSPEILN